MTPKDSRPSVYHLVLPPMEKDGASWGPRLLCGAPIVSSQGRADEPLATGLTDRAEDVTCPACKKKQPA